METINIGNLAIAASAGSGKTFQLSHRFIKLLALGVSPERLIAMTFTRKAAREIFDSIVERICLAATDESERAATCRILGFECSAEDFRAMLHTLLKSLHRLNIGTLDSFIVGVLKNYPMEFGVATSLSLMDSEGAEAQTVRDEVLGRIFNHRRVDEQDRSSFIEAFKQSTFGRRQKSMQTSLTSIIEKWHKMYLEMPDSDSWGKASSIWPTPPRWLAEQTQPRKAVEVVYEWVQRNELKDQEAQHFFEFCDQASHYHPHTSDDKPIKYIFDRVDLHELAEGPVTVKVHKNEYAIDGDMRAALLGLMFHVVGIEISTRLEETAGIYRILDKYEDLYEELAQSTGQLSFLDAQYLLASGNPRSKGRLLSNDFSDKERLSIDYRLDSSFDHWMLDEFQDTSNLQWNVLENLLDEVVQDASNRRSLFYVGDVKQAIYGWRGGNPELFGEILEKYGEAIQVEPLSKSYRSCGEVIDTVNALFAELRCEELPDEACRKWEHVYREHEPARELTGHVALLEHPYSDTSASKPDGKRDERHGAVASILREMDPVGRGLSTAILVRSNDQAKNLVAYLRSHCPGTPLAHEGKSPVADNPAVNILLALVKYAAHPADSLAEGHLRMTPLHSRIANDMNNERLGSALLDEMQNKGMRRFLSTWSQILAESGQLSEYDLNRLEIVQNAAAEFDALNNPEPDRFLVFMEHYKVEQTASAAAVRVMTIHQSKGLGFDIVILPELHNDAINKHHLGRLAFLQNGETDSRADWVLTRPAEYAIRADEVLESALERAHARQAFENLCLIYVAATRAKRGLYMVTSFPGKTSKTLNEAAFIKRQLGLAANTLDGRASVWDGREYTLLYECGSRDWYLAHEKTGYSGRTPKPEQIPADFAQAESTRSRPLRFMPSSAQFDSRNSIADLFARPYGDSLQFGNGIHQLFSRLEWLDDCDLYQLAEEWRLGSALPEKIKRKVCEQFIKNLEQPRIAESFRKPEEKVELWREKAFEIVLDGDWISGAFDRVAIYYDERDRPCRAHLLDFKSNRIDDPENTAEAVERYRSQMETYRRVLARMLNLPTDRIDSQLLFTHSATLIIPF